MLKTGKNREEIEFYLKGKMNEEERKIFEEKLQIHPNLKSELEAYKLVLKHGEDDSRRAFLENLKVAGKKYRADYIEPSHRPDNTLLLLLIGISLLLSVTLFIWTISF